MPCSVLLWVIGSRLQIKRGVTEHQLDSSFETIKQTLVTAICPLSVRQSLPIGMALVTFASLATAIMEP